MAMRVYEFAKQHDMPAKKLVELLRNEGFDIRSHMSALTKESLDFLEKKLSAQKDKPPMEKQKAPVSEKQPIPSNITTEPVAEHKVELRKEQPEQASQGFVVSAMTPAAFAQATEMPVSQVIISLLGWGIMCAKNQVLAPETVARLAEHYGLEVVKPAVLRQAQDEREDVLHKGEVTTGELKERLPVVVVLGHVDHGKTTLLDFIRKTRVAAKEKGGITQHLGAYEVTTAHGDVVFLDTPGHEAFSRMRRRGLRVADVAILVVAADDGVMPQTLEAIKHAKSVNIPIVVAINKIDRVDAPRLEIIKRELSQHDLLPEEWGGDVVCAPISAKLGQGIDHLLEVVVLQSQLMELKADPSMSARCYVLEAKLEKGRGSVATLICQHGTLRVGDYFKVGNTRGRVSTLVNSYGKHVKESGPSLPVQVAGFDDLPEVGALFEVIPFEEYKKWKPTRTTGMRRTAVTTAELAEEQTMNVVLKADSDASREAVVGALEKVAKKLKRPLNIVYAAVGDVSERDIILTSDTNAILYGFNVKVHANAQTLAQKKATTIELFSIIYKLTEALEEHAARTKKIKMISKKIGEAEVRRVFKIKKIGVIAGSYVTSGRCLREGTLVMLRDGTKIGEGKIKSLQRDKKDVKEVAEGFECAFLVDGFDDWQEGDIVECYLSIQEK